MTDVQDPDVFINEVYYLRDELVDMGEVFNDDSILGIVLEGLTYEYLEIKYSAKADNDFILDRTGITMRNMYANRAIGNRPLRKAKGRESAMVVTSTSSAVVTCSHCKKPGHRFQNCFKRKGKMSGKKPPPTPLKNLWCSLHNTDRHDNSDCRSQIRDDNITRRSRPGQQNGRHNNDRSAHANTATTPNFKNANGSVRPRVTSSIHYCGCDYSSNFYVLRDSFLSILTSSWYRLFIHRLTSDQDRRAARRLLHDCVQRSF